MSDVEVEELFSFAAINVGAPRAVGFTNAGTVLVSSVLESVQRRVSRKDSKGSTIESLFRHRVTAWHDDAVWCSEASEPIGQVDFVQPWGDQWLLVGSWCERRRTGPVPNAYWVEQSGRLVRSAVFGYGVADVRAGRDRVWCSYIDQAVFGDDALGPGGESMGGDGVRAFDASGAALSLGGALAGQSIADVYALNVCADDDLWIYAYTQFDLLRLFRGSLSVCPTGVSGARAVCVDRAGAHRWRLRASGPRCRALAPWRWREPRANAAIAVVATRSAGAPFQGPRSDAVRVGRRARRSSAGLVSFHRACS